MTPYVDPMKVREFLKCRKKAMSMNNISGVAR